MTQFHSDEYVEFLSKITPSNMNSFIKEQHKCELCASQVAAFAGDLSTSLRR